MNVSWLMINRESKKTRLVIPGWSILPYYFVNLFPSENLIILNPFIPNIRVINEYCDTILVNEKTQILHESITDVIRKNINNVFIFSMGLQWVQVHAEELFNLPCDIVSPSVAYHNNELDHMIKNLKKSKQATLKVFLKQCFLTSSEWLRWKQEEFGSQVQFTDSKTLITWLDNYGRKRVDIPDKQNIKIWLDLNDPIGIKPKQNTIHIQFNIWSKGHIIESFS